MLQEDAVEPPTAHSQIQARGRSALPDCITHALTNSKSCCSPADGLLGHRVVQRIIRQLSSEEVMSAEDPTSTGA